MLDVITDFWKPVKKQAAQEKPDLDKLQVGSTIGFGFVPQLLLSGRRMKVAGINTYQFGDERMTSFVLAQDKDDMVSMIVASADGEQYLAISRRIPFADRMRMFDPAELDALLEQEDAPRLACRDIDGAWKNWVVANYKKEITGIKGTLTKGDFRNSAVPPSAPSQPFDYTLLTSENNEHAIEIEKYSDGRLELYATIYRRLSDIGEIEHAAGSSPLLEVVKPSPMPIESAAAVLEEVTARTTPEHEEPLSLPVEVQDHAAPEPAETFPVAEAPEAPKMDTDSLFSPQTWIKAEEVSVDTSAPAEEKEPEEFRFEPFQSIPVSTNFTPMESAAMPINANGSSDLENVLKPKFGAFQETRAEENDAIECDLKVANKIIEEAIRNEMRLSDVVRRVIALPVSNPDSVQIPIQLTDSDFQLLAIRYSLPASERAAIKSRIIEELGDFSGNKKQ